VGLGQKLRRQSGIAVGVLGDAATEEGVFWEAVSYATMCRLPVLLICENNRYSTYSPQNKRQPQDNIHERVASFRMRSTALFANDVVAAHRHIAEAFEYVRGGQGPAFVEAYTYRWVGHVGPEDDDYLGYRPASEREFWMNHCPIRLLEERLRGAGMLAAGRRECIEKQVRAELVEGFEFARRSPFPAVAAWEPLNYCASAPLADRLLRDETGGHAFNQNQHDTMPAPY
jgi:pyruvate dehydrogenase E1 component alpha subunit